MVPEGTPDVMNTLGRSVAYVRMYESRFKRGPRISLREVCYSRYVQVTLGLAFRSSSRAPLTGNRRHHILHSTPSGLMAGEEDSST